MRVTLYFQVHQPFRLRRLRSFDPPQAFDYFDGAKDKQVLDRVANRCYLPANEVILKALEEHEGRFRVAFSLSGTLIEQLRIHRPDVLESFRKLAAREDVELLGETYYHSLASLWPEQDEFAGQVKAHDKLLKEEFGREPRVFRNTELIFDNRLAATVQKLGYEAMLTEGTEKILGSRAPTQLYQATCGLPVLLKHYRLSDDVAFRFHDSKWPGWPLTADKYARWLGTTPGDVVNLMMDYETFGEHMWRESGIFDFLAWMPREALKAGNHFLLPTEAARALKPAGVLDAPWAISWADAERDVSAWLGNEMQHEAFEALRRLGPRVHATRDMDTIHAWRKLLTSDHLYYCSTKGIADQSIHAYFSPYDSPYLAFIYLMNAIRDLERKVEARLAARQGGAP